MQENFLLQLYAELRSGHAQDQLTTTPELLKPDTYPLWLCDRNWRTILKDIQKQYPLMCVDRTFSPRARSKHTSCRVPGKCHRDKSLHAGDEQRLVCHVRRET